mmetsp:Transcript_7615/g.10837  ORF Transcript_7615/g.10837 Transcript_7615/m.10837 type:complete len:554 (+) Transcript_7615:242-1903(+)
MAGGIHDGCLLVEFNRSEEDQHCREIQTPKPSNMWMFPDSFRQGLESEIIESKHQQVYKERINDLDTTVGRSNSSEYNNINCQNDSDSCNPLKRRLSDNGRVSSSPRNPLAMLGLGSWYTGKMGGSSKTLGKKSNSARHNNDRHGPQSRRTSCNTHHENDSMVSGATANISPFASSTNLNHNNAPSSSRIESSSQHTRGGCSVTGSISTSACGKVLSSHALQRMTEFKRDSIVTHRWEDITNAPPNDYEGHDDLNSSAGVTMESASLRGTSQNNLSTPSLPRIAENAKSPHPSETYELGHQDNYYVQPDQPQQHMAPNVIRDTFSSSNFDFDSDDSDSESSSSDSDSESDCSDLEDEGDFFNSPPPAHLMTNWLMQQAELDCDHSFSSEDTFMFFDEEEEEVEPLDLPGVWTSTHDRGMQRMPISKSLHARPNNNAAIRAKGSDISKSTSATSATTTSSAPAQESAWPLHVVSVEIPKLKPEIPKPDSRNDLAGLAPEDFEEFWSPERREQEMRKQLAMALKTYQTQGKKNKDPMDVSSRKTRHIGYQRVNSC